jgi:hypothetical protein
MKTFIMNSILETIKGSLSLHRNGNKSPGILILEAQI